MEELPTIGRCLKKVIRIRWSERSPEDSASSTGWWLPSIILATIFLNFPFWFVFEREIPFSGPPWAYFGVLGGIALLFVALFYLGPALAMQSSKRSLYSLAESSFGSIPAVGFRLCCAFYLVTMADVFRPDDCSFVVPVAIPPRSDPSRIRTAWGGHYSLTLWDRIAGLRTSAKLAGFTNKLSLAILIAALIRVREGWPSAWEALSHSPALREVTDWRSIPFILFYFAPLALFSSDLGYRSRKRKDVMLIGLVGLALAFAVSLFVAAFIAQATHGLRLI